MLKIEKRFTLYCFFENKVHFYPIIVVNTKTTIPSGLVPSARYIPRPLTSRYITTTIHLPFGGLLLIIIHTCFPKSFSTVSVVMVKAIAKGHTILVNF